MFVLSIQDPQNAGPAPQPQVDAYGQLSKLASTFHDVDGLFYFTYAVCIFFFVLILGVLLFSVVKYRRKTADQPAASNVTHNTPLEVVWTVIPLIIVMVMFAWGYKGADQMVDVPKEAARNAYKAMAKQWSWTFTYPDGSVSYGDVWVEKDKPVQFYLQSSDVLHAFYVPSMRVKRDVIPGRMQTVWFQPTEEGIYHLFCAEYCGNDHSKMYARVHVVPSAEFKKRPWDDFDDSTPELAAKSGESLYSRNCAVCHSVDGTPLVGPSWKGLFVKGEGDTIVGAKRTVIEGGATKEITVDDAYVLESVRTPAQKLVATHPNGGMSSFGPELIDDRRVKAIITYMKSLASK